MTAISRLDSLDKTYNLVPHTVVDSNEPYLPTGYPDAVTERKTAKGAFLDGQGDWPQITYPNLDTPPLEPSEKAYWGVLHGVVQHDALVGESPESELLYEQTARKLAEVYRHMEARRLGESTLAAASVSRGRAGVMSAELFGTPDVEVFRSLLAADVGVALRELDSEDDTRSTLAHEYLELLGMTPETAQGYAEAHNAAPPAELAAETIRVIREDLFTLYPELPAMVEAFQRTEDTLAADAVPAFEAALRAFGLEKKGWRVKLLPGTNAAEAHGATKQISFGRKRKSFTPTAIVGVPIHESTHALRKQNASEQTLRHRRGALPGSLEFDEGLGVALEQVVTGETRVGGKAYYTQLGLQLGLEQDQATPRNFRQTYEIMWRQRALAQKGELTDEALAGHKELAYRSVMRTSRGNSNDFRDISYFEGSRKAVGFLNALVELPASERRRTLMWVFSGVFDPTNPAQAAVFEDAGDRPGKRS